MVFYKKNYFIVLNIMKCPRRRKYVYLSRSERFISMLGRRINDLLRSCLGDLISQHVSDPAIKLENRHSLYDTKDCTHYLIH